MRLTLQLFMTCCGLHSLSSEQPAGQSGCRHHPFGGTSWVYQAWCPWRQKLEELKQLSRFYAAFICHIYAVHCPLEKLAPSHILPTGSPVMSIQACCRALWRLITLRLCGEQVVLSILRSAW